MTDAELKRLLEANSTETRRHFDVTAEGLRKDLDASVVQIRRHFDVTAERFEKRFDALAEAVAQVDEKVDRQGEEIRDEMRRGFADTQAMIKFSHAELDRRIRALEEGFADLQARVERLESTH